MGDYKLKIFPDEIDEITEHIASANMYISNRFRFRRCWSASRGRRKRQAGSPAEAHGAIHHAGGWGVYGKRY